jgi:hypothetical protein
MGRAAAEPAESLHPKDPLMTLPNRRSLLRVPRAWVRRMLVAGVIALQGGAAFAIEIGPLILRRDIPPGVLGQFRVYDRTPIEASQFTIRLAHADAYAALGLKYDRALGGVAVSIEPTMDSGLTVLLRPLPTATVDNRPLDIVVVIFEGMRLTTRLFRVDLRSSASEFAAVDPTETSIATNARQAQRGAPSAAGALATKAPATSTPAAASTPQPAPAAASLPAPTQATAVAAAAPVAPPKPAANVAAAPAAPASIVTVAKPSAPPPAAAPGTAAEVMRAVERWADAWAGREIEAYAATYVPDFRGNLRSHAEWVAFRKARLAARRQIDIDLSEVAVKVDGARAEVRFVQKYRGDKTELIDRKRLLMVRNPAGAWLIQEEVTL